MSLHEIFHKVQGWVAELWNHHPPLETLLFLAALIISVMAAINALAVSTSTSGNWKDNSDAEGPQRREATRRFDAPVQREYFNAERELS
jgi:hypothetical protein